MATSRSCLVLLSLGLCLACPAKVPTPRTEAQSGPSSPEGVPVVDDSDPRVVRDGDDLYALGSAPRRPSEEPALGSGKPDTSNGVCKLFAPKLPEPECCPFETGFDAERIKQICGHELYMGESLQQSCGYFFLPDMQGSSPVSIRASKINSEDVAGAVTDHDQRMAQITKNSAFASTPVPGQLGRRCLPARQDARSPRADGRGRRAAPKRAARARAQSPAASQPVATGVEPIGCNLPPCTPGNGGRATRARLGPSASICCTAQSGWRWSAS
jgi:hypothetical protein